MGPGGKARVRGRIAELGFVSTVKENDISVREPCQYVPLHSHDLSNGVSAVALDF